MKTTTRPGFYVRFVLSESYDADGWLKEKADQWFDSKRNAELFANDYNRFSTDARKGGYAFVVEVTAN